MQKILSQLIEQTAEALRSEGLESEQSDELQASLSSLVLARTALIKRQLREQAVLPLQVAVVGPTQVGKSSLVNWLLASDLAGASARASHTVHCSGYAIGEVAGQNHDSWAEKIFSDMHRRDGRHLDRQIISEFSIDAVPGVDRLPSCILWDTPDFDSLQSFRYRMAVLQAVALADLVVFVVSPEKYADRSVWSMLEQMDQLGLPCLMIMNKTPHAARGELGQSLRSKYTAKISAVAPDIGFIDEFRGVGGQPDPIDVANVLQLVAGRVQPVADQRQNLLGFMREQWPRWTGAAARERDAAREWATMVRSACETFRHDYQREYLEHSRKDETLQLALAELLVLLEVPGIAQPLIRLRGIVTWPVRQLMSQVDSKRERAETGKKDISEESRLLTQMGDQAVNVLSSSLASRLIDETDERWWDSLSGRFTASRDDIQADYQRAVDQYQEALQVEIRKVARGLYQQLQEQPATLNGLRAARVSADAAAVVLAVKSGGLGLADLVIAPAMLSLTTMLTEGALGKYMEKVQADLKAHQLSQVMETMHNQLQKPLEALAVQSGASGWAGIADDILAEGQARLERGDV